MTTEQLRAADWANPAMLTREREQVNLSIPDVASKLKIAEERVAAWENGDERPLLADLRELARLYLCPVGYFFLLESPTTTTLDFRGLDESKELTYDSHKTLRRFLRYVDIAGDWIDRLGGSKEASIPELRLWDPAGAAREAVELLGVTQEVRESWTTDNEAFAGWRQAVEQRGVFVFSIALPTGEVRGASTWPEDGVPAILVNHSDIESATGRIFTLLHELAHLLVRKAGIVCDFRGQPELEEFANRFAARAIVPMPVLRNHLSSVGLLESKAHWTEAELDRVRQPFHASRDVVAISLEELRLAPGGYYRKRRIAWEKRRPFGRGGGGQKRAVLRHRELGYRMSDLVLMASQSGAVSPLDVDDVLGTSIDKFRQYVRAGDTD